MKRYDVYEQIGNFSNLAFSSVDFNEVQDYLEKRFEESDYDKESESDRELFFSYFSVEEIDAYELSGETYQKLHDLSAGETMELDGFMAGVSLTVTKDCCYDSNEDGTKDYYYEGIEDEWNLVQVSFKINDREIASTGDIHVTELENTLTDIRNGATGILIDEEKPLTELVSEAGASRNSVSLGYDR